MWCGKCQADVAAEVSSDNQRVFCTVCGGLLSTVAIPPSPPAPEAKGRIQDARELLKRWSSQSTSDPYAPLQPKPSLTDHEVLAVRPGDSVSLAPLPPLTPPKPQPLPPPAINLPSSEPRSELISAIVSTTAPIAPSEPAAILQEPLLSEPTKGPVATNWLADVTALPSSESLLHEITSSPLAVPLTSPQIPPLPSPLLAPVDPLISQKEWPVLGGSDANPPSSAANDVIRRIDAAHPQSRFSDRTLPMPFPNFGSPPSVMDAESVRVQTLAAPHVDSHEVSRDSVNPERRSSATGALGDPLKASPKVKTLSTASEQARSQSWLPQWDAAMWRSENISGSNLSVTAGQLLAYGGVLGLTVGGCMVVWSFFGGPVNYAQTGWLVATAGQMLLFFGVITLVSGGLEQTAEQVNRRIEQLGDHIVRIEQAAREYGSNGSVPAAHFAQAEDQRTALAESADERAVVEN